MICSGSSTSRLSTPPLGPRPASAATAPLCTKDTGSVGYLASRRIDAVLNRVRVCLPLRSDAVLSTRLSTRRKSRGGRQRRGSTGLATPDWSRDIQSTGSQLAARNRSSSRSCVEAGSVQGSGPLDAWLGEDSERGRWTLRQWELRLINLWLRLWPSLYTLRTT